MEFSQNFVAFSEYMNFKTVDSKLILFLKNQVRQTGFLACKNQVGSKNPVRNRLKYRSTGGMIPTNKRIFSITKSQIFLCMFSSRPCLFLTGIQNNISDCLKLDILEHCKASHSLTKLGYKPNLEHSIHDP